MSDDDDQDLDEERTITLSRDQIRGLETKAKKFDEAETRAATAERELAFAKAGIDLNDKRLEYFRKGYDGELDADEIRNAAAEAGFIAPPAGSGNAEELAGMQRIADAGSEAITPADPSPTVDRLNAAQSQEEIMAIIAESPEARVAGEA